MRFEGVCTPVITPFSEGFSIDAAVYVVSVVYLVEAGVRGITAGGTMGECYDETYGKRVQLLEFTQQRCAYRPPVIFGTGSIDPDESIRLVKAPTERKVDAILVVAIPFLCRPNVKWHSTFSPLIVALTCLSCLSMPLAWGGMGEASPDRYLALRTSVLLRKAVAISIACIFSYREIPICKLPAVWMAKR